MKMSNIKYFLIAFLSVIIQGCKMGFLDDKPSTKIVVPSTLDDLQSLLEYNIINLSADPALNTLSADEYDFRDYAAFQSAGASYYRTAATWNKVIFDGNQDNNWGPPYKKVFCANVVLEQLDKIIVDSLNNKRWNDIKGQALFSRSWAFFQLLQTFSPTYDISTQNQDLGIPLRLSPDVNNTLQRASLNDSYNQVITDLEQASKLLSASYDRSKPHYGSKAAAYALLSRIYLSMRQYDKAETYADICLTLYSVLNDYNTRSTTSNAPFNYLNNDEIIYLSVNYGTSLTGNTAYVVNQDLLTSYSSNDLRPLLYFRINAATGQYYFKTAYAGIGGNFTGLATDEIYLIKAECQARNNQTGAAMNTLNTLLKNRFSGVYTDLTANSASDALQLVLNERRKELILRGLRWSDLKRLNKEGANITLTRVVNGVTYTLPPNDPRYVMPIPDNEINISGIQQNIR
ncbi:Starch-binding associating with outer membrane [bacterium A37T11]|nr:Starch-binding associating with outer membrane [bacterium A37T11]